MDDPKDSEVLESFPPLTNNNSYSKLLEWRLSNSLALHELRSEGYDDFNHEILEINHDSNKLLTRGVFEFDNPMPYLDQSNAYLDYTRKSQMLENRERKLSIFDQNDMPVDEVNTPLPLRRVIFRVIEMEKTMLGMIER